MSKGFSGSAAVRSEPQELSSHLLSQHLLEAAWPGRRVPGRVHRGPVHGPRENRTGASLFCENSDRRARPGSPGDKHLLCEHLSLPWQKAGPTSQPRTQRRDAARLRKQVPVFSKGLTRNAETGSLKPGHHTKNQPHTQFRITKCSATLGPQCHLGKQKHA